MNKNNIAIQISHLTVTYQEQPVLFDVSCALPQGKMIAIVGPNGAGKTTLMKTMLGLIKPVAGTITFTHTERTHDIAYIPQRSSIDWDFPCTVLDVVLMGRYRHMGWFARPGKNDQAQAMAALDQLNMAMYAHRHIGALSGGQQQRVFLARALVQEPSLLLLDEPFVGIDLTTEKMIVSFLKQLTNAGKTVVVVHHDLQTLAEYFDWVLLMNVRGVAVGPVHEVLKPEFICAAYGERNIFVNRMDMP